MERRVLPRCKLAPLRNAPPLPGAKFVADGDLSPLRDMPRKQEQEAAQKKLKSQFPLKEPVSPGSFPERAPPRLPQAYTAGMFSSPFPDDAHFPEPYTTPDSSSLGKVNARGQIKGKIPEDYGEQHRPFQSVLSPSQLLARERPSEIKDSCLKPSAHIGANAHIANSRTTAFFQRQQTLTGSMHQIKGVGQPLSCKSVTKPDTLPEPTSQRSPVPQPRNETNKPGLPKKYKEDYMHIDFAERKSEENDKGSLSNVNLLKPVQPTILPDTDSSASGDEKTDEFSSDGLENIKVKIDGSQVRVEQSLSGEIAQLRYAVQSLSEERDDAVGRCMELQDELDKECLKRLEADRTIEELEAVNKVMKNQTNQQVNAEIEPLGANQNVNDTIIIDLKKENNQLGVKMRRLEQKIKHYATEKKELEAKCVLLEQEVKSADEHIRKTESSVLGSDGGKEEELHRQIETLRKQIANSPKKCSPDLKQIELKSKLIEAETIMKWQEDELSKINSLLEKGNTSNTVKESSVKEETVPIIVTMVHDREHQMQQKILELEKKLHEAEGLEDKYKQGHVLFKEQFYESKLLKICQAQLKKSNSDLQDELRCSEKDLKKKLKVAKEDLAESEMNNAMLIDQVESASDALEEAETQRLELEEKQQEDKCRLLKLQCSYNYVACKLSDYMRQRNTTDPHCHLSKSLPVLLERPLTRDVPPVPDPIHNSSRDPECLELALRDIVVLQERLHAQVAEKEDAMEQLNRGVHRIDHLCERLGEETEKRAQAEEKLELIKAAKDKIESELEENKSALLNHSSDSYAESCSERNANLKMVMSEIDMLLAKVKFSQAALLDQQSQTEVNQETALHIQQNLKEEICPVTEAKYNLEDEYQEKHNNSLYPEHLENKRDPDTNISTSQTTNKHLPDEVHKLVDCLQLSEYDVEAFLKEVAEVKHVKEHNKQLQNKIEQEEEMTTEIIKIVECFETYIDLIRSLHTQNEVASKLQRDRSENQLKLKIQRLELSTEIQLAEDKKVLNSKDERIKDLLQTLEEQERQTNEHKVDNEHEKLVADKLSVKLCQLYHTVMGETNDGEITKDMVNGACRKFFCLQEELENLKKTRCKPALNCIELKSRMNGASKQMEEQKEKINTLQKSGIKWRHRAVTLKNIANGLRKQLEEVLALLASEEGGSTPECISITSQMWKKINSFQSTMWQTTSCPQLVGAAFEFEAMLNQMKQDLDTKQGELEHQLARKEKEQSEWKQEMNTLKIKLLKSEDEKDDADQVIKMQKQSIQDLKKKMRMVSIELETKRQELKRMSDTNYSVEHDFEHMKLLKQSEKGGLKEELEQSVNENMELIVKIGQLESNINCHDKEIDHLKEKHRMNLKRLETGHLKKAAETSRKLSWLEKKLDMLLENSIGHQEQEQDSKISWMMTGDGLQRREEDGLQSLREEDGLQSRREEDGQQRRGEEDGQQRRREEDGLHMRREDGGLQRRITVNGLPIREVDEQSGAMCRQRAWYDEDNDSGLDINGIKCIEWKKEHADNELDQCD